MNIVRSLENLIIDMDFYEAGHEVLISTSCLEILCPLSGKLIMGDLSLTDMDILILPPEKEHKIQAEDNTVFFRISLNMKFFAENLSYDLLELLLKDLKVVEEGELREIIKRFIFFSDSSIRTKKISLAAAIVSEIEDLYRPELKKKLTGQQLRLYSEVVEAIEKADGNPRLDDLAENLGITPQYLTSFWKKISGMPLLKYIKENEEQRRILREHFSGDKKTYLINGVKSISDGRIHKIKENFLAEIEADDNAKDENTEVIMAAPDFRRRIDPIWLNLINLGYAKDLYQGRLNSIIERIQSKCGFKYGRICMLFDLIEMYSLGGKIYYSYSKIFSLIDLMIKNHMLPFIELGNKQFKIQFSVKEHFSPSDPYDPNEYFEKVIDLFPGFLRECINRYGYSNVEKWRFEIGYPPYLDADIEKKKDFPFARYSFYFKKIKGIVKELLPECMIGGPGFNSWGNKEEIAEILEIMEKQEASPDFITAYIYPLTDSSTVAEVSKNPDLPKERMKFLADFVKGKKASYEVWITEFNSNLSSRTLINDSQYQASFLINQVYSAIETGIKAVGYYLISDHSLRFADNYDLLFGGWGIFTDTDLPKPVFHAYSFLSELGKYIIGIGKNYIVCSNSAADIQCIIFSYQHLQDKYRIRNMTKEDVMAEYSGESDYETTKIQIRFPELTAGKYEIETHSISSMEANLLYEWYRLGFETPVQTDMNSALAKRSEIMPTMMIKTLKTDGTLTVDTELKRSEVRLFKIRLQREEQ
ncbi:MAG: hypothetical protein K5894_04290 [Lachnospiraceae bacterium]|nr:hypothetical protein [Lachnospiraceae bacterium]